MRPGSLSSYTRERERNFNRPLLLSVESNDAGFDARSLSVPWAQGVVDFARFSLLRFLDRRRPSLPCDDDDDDDSAATATSALSAIDSRRSLVAAHCLSALPLCV